MRSALRRGRPRSFGQSLVEFAIVLPVLMLILLAAIDFGRIYLQWVELNNVAKIGANYAALHPEGWDGSGNATVQAAYQRLIGKDLTNLNCQHTGPWPDPTFPDASPNTYIVGGHARVDLTCQFQFVTPFIGGVFGGSSGLPVGASAIFTIRGGTIGGLPVGTTAPSGSPSATPSGGGSPSPSPSPSPSSSGGVTVSFYGLGRGSDAQGGGPPGSNGENQIVGIPGLIVDFTNTTTGTKTSCQWTFGDGATLSSCGSPVNHQYNSRGVYDVTLTVNGTALTRSQYVLIGCQVPNFIGVHVNDAQTTWAAAGFSTTVTKLSGNGNYKIGNQTLAGGTLNPSGGCAGATITVGP